MFNNWVRIINIIHIDLLVYCFIATRNTINVLAKFI
jgi:hypothetical protein